MEQFKITIKNDKTFGYRVIAAISLFINVAILIYLLFFDAYRISVSISLLMLLVYFGIRKYEINKKKSGYLINEWLFFLLAFCWLGINNYWLTVICFVMGMLFFLALQKTQIYFAANGVQQLNFPRKFYKWSHLENVILKDDFLTMDFKSNRILQVLIDPTEEIDEEKFNDFVSRQIDQSTFNPN